MSRDQRELVRTHPWNGLHTFGFTILKSLLVGCWAHGLLRLCGGDSSRDAQEPQHWHAMAVRYRCHVCSY